MGKHKYFICVNNNCAEKNKWHIRSDVFNQKHKLCDKKSCDCVEICKNKTKENE